MFKMEKEGLKVKNEGRNIYSLSVRVIEVLLRMVKESGIEVILKEIINGNFLKLLKDIKIYI